MPNYFRKKTGLFGQIAGGWEAIILSIIDNMQFNVVQHLGLTTQFVSLTRHGLTLLSNLSKKNPKVHCSLGKWIALPWVEWGFRDHLCINWVHDHYTVKLDNSASPSKFPQKTGFENDKKWVFHKEKLNAIDTVMKNTFYHCQDQFFVGIWPGWNWKDWCN